MLGLNKGLPFRSYPTLVEGGRTIGIWGVRINVIVGSIVSEIEYE